MENLKQKNLQQLSQTNPELAAAVTDCKPSGRLHVIPTPAGYQTLLHSPADGPAGFLHHPDDPLQEAEEMLAGQVFNGEDMTVLLGFGLGYLPLAIIKRMHPMHRLVIVEAGPEVLLNAFEQMDFSPLWQNKRVHVLGADQMQRLWEILLGEPLKIGGGAVRKLIHRACLGLFPAVYREVEADIEQMVAALKESFHNLEIYWPKTIRNVLGNLPELVDARPVDDLFEIARGNPALVVAAGPSLDKNIARIKSMCDRFVIIAVDRALRPLVMEGVLPDLVLSIDPNSENLKKFEQIPGRALEQTPLVFSPLVYSEIPKRFASEKFVFGDQNHFSRWALGLRTPVSELPAGFSVAHSAFYLARLMGADPIIFAGLDLAYGPDSDHAKNSVLQRRDKVDLQNAVWVPGVGGEKVATCEGYMRMITLFEREIAQTRARCIDATEGGARIRGADEMTLDATVRRWGRGSKSAFRKRLQKRKSASAQASAMSPDDGVRWLYAQARDVGMDCREALALWPDQSMSGDIDFGRLQKQVNRMADRIQTHHRFLEIVKDQMAPVLAGQYRIGFEVERTPGAREKHALEIQKSHLFFSRLAEVCETVCRNMHADTKKAPFMTAPVIGNQAACQDDGRANAFGPRI